MVFCMFLLSCENASIQRESQSKQSVPAQQNDRQLPTVIEHHDEQADDRAPSRTTVISAPEEEEATCSDRR